MNNNPLFFIWFGFVVFHTLLLFGCTENRIKWNAAREYQQALTKSIPKLKAFVRTMQMLPDTGNHKELRLHINHHTKQALARYISHLKSIHPKTEELKEIHFLRCNAYEKWQKALERFVSTANTPSKQAKAAFYIREVSQFLTREENHARMLLKVYVDGIVRAN